MRCKVSLENSLAFLVFNVPDVRKDVGGKLHRNVQRFPPHDDCHQELVVAVHVLVVAQQCLKYVFTVGTQLKVKL